MRILKNTSKISNEELKDIFNKVSKVMEVTVRGLVVMAGNSKVYGNDCSGRCWNSDRTRLGRGSKWETCKGRIFLRFGEKLTKDSPEVYALIAHELSHHKDNMEYRRKGYEIPHAKERRANGWAVRVVRELGFTEEQVEHIKKWEEWRLERGRV